MNGVDETGATVADDPGGLSRRDLIAKSVVAGGLVWAAPTLMSTPAGATGGCSCIGGVKTTIKIPSEPQPELWRLVLVQTCAPELALPARSLRVPRGRRATSRPTSSRTARYARRRIVLSGGIRLLAAGVKSTDDCYFADCANGFCPNTDDDGNTAAQYITVCGRRAIWRVDLRASGRKRAADVENCIA